MNIESIMIISTALITYITGLITKGKVINSKYVPLQNMIIGALAGIIAYACGLSEDLLPCIFNCMIGSLTAGGAYDAIAIKSKIEKGE